MPHLGRPDDILILQTTGYEAAHAQQFSPSSSDEAARAVLLDMSDPSLCCLRRGGGKLCNEALPALTSACAAGFIVVVLPSFPIRPNSAGATRPELGDPAKFVR